MHLVSSVSPPVRTAAATAILVVSVVVAGCAGPSESPEDADGNETSTTYTENEFGAHPDSPGDDTANQTSTPGTTQVGGTETVTTQAEETQTGTNTTETNTAEAVRGDFLG